MVKSVFGIFFALAFLLCISQNDAAALKPCRPRIIDLPVELLLIICSNTDVAGLNGLAKLHPRIQHVAEIAFKENFAANMFVVDEYGLGINNSDGILSNIDKALTFETFGHLIEKLEISYSESDIWQEVNRVITEYLGNSLKEIAFKRASIERLKGLTGPFNKVEVVKFVSSEVNSADINLHEMFPMVRAFHVEDIESLIPAIQHHFEHLEEMKETYGSVASIGFITLNPQLRSFATNNADIYLMRNISKLLPDLERLEIAYSFFQRLPPIEGVDVHFENLKSFKAMHIKDFANDEAPIVFGNLEEFSLESIVGPVYDIIVQNKKIKMISVNRISHGNFLGLAVKLPNLEVIISRAAVVNMDDVLRIVQFINTAKNLKKIELQNCAIDRRGEILERIQDEWEVASNVNTDYVTFVKRG